MNQTSAATERLQAMAQWWRSAEGDALWQAENAVLEPWLARCFGYHALHLNLQPLPGGVVDSAAVQAAGLRIPHAFRLGPLGGEVRARFESLPLEAESVDLVIVQHALELTSEPHALLRELDRVLVPEGRVVVLSFNPLSYWGLRRWLNFREKAPWLGAAPGRKRLRDWLSLLGYDLEDETWVGHGCCVRPGHSRLVGFVQRRLSRLFPRSGVAHLLLARKRVSMPAPIRHRWRLMPSLGVSKSGRVAGQASASVMQHTEKDVLHGSKNR